MATNRSRLQYLAEYVGARTAAGLLQCFDVDQNLQTAASIGSLFYRFDDRRRERAISNISLSFPDWSRDRCEHIAERSMQNMFQLFLVDSVFTPRLITPVSWPRYVRLGPGIAPIVDRMIRNEPAIFITAHCGNWELLGFALAVLGYPLSAIARPLDNPYLNRWLLGIREARGMRIITKWGGSTVVQDELRRGGRIAFTADQNAGDQGLFVPFFGRLASSYKSISILAMRYRVPIVAGHSRRLNGRFEFEIDIADIIKPDDWSDQPDPIFYLTARYNRAMERMIAAAPDQYLWLHRRWKSRPRHEREGNPIPDRLIGKLRELPWMTEPELERIIDHSNQGVALNRQ